MIGAELANLPSATVLFLPAGYAGYFIAIQVTVSTKSQRIQPFPVPSSAFLHFAHQLLMRLPHPERLLTAECDDLLPPMAHSPRDFGRQAFTFVDGCPEARVYGTEAVHYAWLCYLS